jgi:hypothetical protein
MASYTVCATPPPPPKKKYIYIYIGATSRLWLPYYGPSHARRRCRKYVIALCLCTPAPYCTRHPHELKVRIRPRDVVRSANTVLCVVLVGHSSVSVRHRVRVPMCAHGKNCWRIIRTWKEDLNWTVLSTEPRYFNLTVIWKRVRKIAKSYCWSSSRPSAWNSAPAGRIFVKFRMCTFSIVCRENSRFVKILTGIRITVHEDLCTFTIISHSVFPRMKLFQKRFRENKTHFVFNNYFPLKSCCLWDNVEKHGFTRQATYYNIIRPMRIACWITKATDRIINTYCFSTARMVTRTRLSYTFIRTSPALL